ncbi:MAG: hypothetical protein ACR2FU_12835 [Streptosporangiaceae bacterium]
MQRLHFRETPVLSASLAVIIGLGLAACSSSGGGGSTTPTTAPSSQTSSSSGPAGSSGEPTTGSGAVAAIKANWATFFNAKTTTARRVQLLQNGQVLATVLQAQAKNTLAATATSTVSAVTLTGTNQASVTYTILVSGQPVLKGQHGVAVYQDGIWKVGLVSFCGLLKLENGGKSSGLPAGCAG